MSSPTSADAQALTDRANQPTLLDIPAELRNVIYYDVFSSETKRNLAPHPLTRVNKCIRCESLAMYYESVKSKSLEIPLHNATDFALAKQSLSDVDTNPHQVLPDIEFSWTEYRAFGSYKIAMRCAREVTTIDEESGRQVDWCDQTGVRSGHILEESLRQAYDYCLGFSKLEIWVPPVPPNFKNAVWEEEDITWIVRHLSLLSDCWRYPCISMFTDLAIRKNGHDREMRDLRYIIESLEDFVGRPS